MDKFINWLDIINEDCLTLMLSDLNPWVNNGSSLRNCDLQDWGY